MPTLRDGRFVHWSLIVIALAIGIAAASVVDRERIQYRRTHRVLTMNAAHPFRVANSTFRFIDPLLGYELPTRENVQPFRAIRTALESVINETTRAQQATNISVYYRDLKTGSWFGIDERRKYAPASLAKVPLMIAYLKLAEQQPWVLQRRVTFTRAQTQAPKQNITPSEHLVLGHTYTIDELLRAMIVYSDNQAAFLLQTTADPSALAAVYADLNIDPPDFNDPNDVITPEAFARFFRFLYNGTYLTRNLSEYALKLLSESTFDRGIVAGVPPGIPVAHKFGERVFDHVGVGAPITELHDCGIVYHPNHPYLLCVMSRGWDLDTLASAIARLADAAYTAVDHMSSANSELVDP